MEVVVGRAMAVAAEDTVAMAAATMVVAATAREKAMART